MSIHIEDNPSMIHAVRVGDITPGCRIQDKNGIRYIKMDARGTVLRTVDGKVFLISCMTYPVEVSNAEA